MHTILDERDKLEITDRIGSISNNLFRVTKTGKSIVAEDSARYIPKGLRVFGGSEQKTTTGAQLFDASKLTKNHNSSLDILDEGYTIVATGGTIQGYVHSSHSFNPSQFGFNGKSVYLIADNITSSCEESTGSVAQAYFKDTNGAMQFYNLYRGTNLSTKIDVPEYCTELTIGIYTNNTGKALDVDNTVTVKGLRLSLSNNTPWEPYTGGIPAPNPEYPQEIVDTMLEEVGVYGKNLLNNTAQSQTVKGVTFTVNDDKSVTANGTATGKTFLEVISGTLPSGTYILSAGVYINDTTRMQIVDANDSTIVYAMTSNASEKTFTLNSDANVIVQIRVESGYTANNIVFKPMIRFASITDGTYKPCTKQSLAITTPNGLPGIKVTDATLATYTDENGQMWCSDEVDFERGVYVQRIVRKSYTKGNVFSGGNSQYFFAGVGDNVLRIQSFYCNIANHKTNNSEYGNCWITGDGRLIIGNLDANGNPVYSTVDDLFENANINTVDILGILADPIETPLSAEELEAYRALTMNYPTTTILNNANAHMEVEYVANTQNHIEQNYLSKSEFETLKTRISSIEKSIL